MKYQVFAIMVMCYFCAHTQSAYNKACVQYETAYSYWPHDKERACVLLKQMLDEFAHYYEQDKENSALGGLLSKAEYHLGIAEEERPLTMQKLYALSTHFDKALSYVSGIFPNAFAYLTQTYAQLFEMKDHDAELDIDSMIRYIDQCKRHLSRYSILPREIVAVAQSVKARMQMLLAKEWSTVSATIEHNRAYILKGLSYMQELRQYVEDNSCVILPAKIIQYRASSGYYSLKLWLSLGSYYADQASTSGLLADYDQALDYLTKVIMQHPEVVYLHEALRQIYQAAQNWADLQELALRQPFLSTIYKRTIFLKSIVLSKKALRLRTTGKKNQVEQACLLLQDALSLLAPYAAFYQEQFNELLQQFAHAKLLRAQAYIYDKHAVCGQYKYSADIEYALNRGTVQVQAQALLVKAYYTLMQATTYADFTAVKQLLDRAQENSTSTEELESLLTRLKIEYHTKRAALLVQDNCLFDTPLLQTHLQESIDFCCACPDSVLQKDGMYYTALWLSKQHTYTAAHKALALLAELKAQQYALKKLKQIITELQITADYLHQHEQQIKAEELARVLWQEYQHADAGYLLVMLLSVHKNSCDYALRLIALIKEIYPRVSTRAQKQELQALLDHCYYVEARSHSGSFDKILLEQALDYFQKKQLMADPAAQRAYTALAQQIETADELFTLVARFKCVTPYVKDALIAIIRAFYSQLDLDTTYNNNQQWRKLIEQKAEVLQKYSSYLTAQEQQDLLSTLYITYMPLLINEYSSMYKIPKQSKKYNKKSTLALKYIHQLLSFIKEHVHTPEAENALALFYKQVRSFESPKVKRSCAKQLQPKTQKNKIPITQEQTLIANLEQLVLDNEAINRPVLEQAYNITNSTIKKSTRNSAAQDKISDYYFFAGVDYTRQELEHLYREYTVKCHSQEQTQNAYAELIYNQALVCLAGNRQTTFEHGFALLKESAALGYFAANYLLAQLYRRTYTLWPSLKAIFVDPLCYGLPSYTYLAHVTRELITHTNAYKQWRSAFCTQAHTVAQALDKALIGSAYYNLPECTILEQNQELCDAYLSGVGYVYLERCVHLCQTTTEAALHTLKPSLEKLLEEALLCPQVNEYRPKKRKKEHHHYDQAAYEIATWLKNSAAGEK